MKLSQLNNPNLRAPGAVQDLLGCAGSSWGSQTGHPGKGNLSEGHLSWGFSSPGLIHQVVLQHK